MSSLSMKIKKIRRNCIQIFSSVKKTKRLEKKFTNLIKKQIHNWIINNKDLSKQ